jgi:hypothetical protein
MPADINDPSKALAYRQSLTPRDRALYDRSAKQELVVREIALLNILLGSLITNPPTKGRDFTVTIQTLSRAIYLHSQQAAGNEEDDPLDLEALGEQVRAALAQEAQ